ncbi:MAG: hypothetical protein PHI12_09120 [Dehalococcoidales bacterium]|nr:hypothetical protein [Dehalococcoidales bacterium]
MRKLIERIEQDAAGLGPGGICKCPNCGYEEEHKTSEPCGQIECPKCGARMGRLVP